MRLYTNTLQRNNELKVFCRENIAVPTVTYPQTMNYESLSLVEVGEDGILNWPVSATSKAAEPMMTCRCPPHII